MSTVGLRFIQRRVYLPQWDLLFFKILARQEISHLHIGAIGARRLWRALENPSTQQFGSTSHDRRKSL